VKPATESEEENTDDNSDIKNAGNDFFLETFALQLGVMNIIR